MGVAEPPAAPKISIRGVTKHFALRGSTITAVAGVTVDIPEGEFFVIVGPSGCGKTTLLRILAGLERPTGGEVLLRRRDAARPINAMVFQEESVFPWMTVEDNIGYGLRMRGVPRARRRLIVRGYLEKMGLAAFARAFPHQLSGGMKQRTSIARALANDPEILLMDEPFASLDEQTKMLLQQELVRVWEAERKTVVFITHSIDEALLLGDRVVVMTARPGTLKQELTVPFRRPRDLFDLRADPSFASLGREVWALLRDEVLRSQAGTVA
jgi:NitT/TauT family transport system ATP-binding protein